MGTVSYDDTTVSVQNPHFLLTNKKGDYLALGSPNSSNYNGFFARNGDSYFKILADLHPNTDGEMHLTLKDSSILRKQGETLQEISLCDTGVSARLRGEFSLLLDCKRLYDESTEGRFYSVDIRPAQNTDEYAKSLAKVSVVNVTYEKRSNPEASPEYRVHITVATTSRVVQVGEWRETIYGYDSRRETSTSPWNYEAARLEGDGVFALAVGETKSEAQSKALQLLMRRPVIKKDTIKHELPEVRIAWQALRALHTKDGIMAGLPWFFKYWSRDELVSVGGLIAADRYEDVIKILDRWYREVGEDGKLSAIYPAEGNESIDAPGWLGKRTTDLLEALKREGKMHLISDEQKDAWCLASGRMLDHIRKEHMRDGLVWSDRNTTWMDTSWDDEGREGWCIEIQALTIALADSYSRLCVLTGQQALHERIDLAREIASSVHSRMIEGDLLVDRIHPDGNRDAVPRPNIFLAWYIAPRLFSRDKWKIFFHRVLPELWLDWGGLSSIARDAPTFHASYTGENVASYHRGDSWYFVNNIAAMAMHDVDPEGFRAPVAKIIRAGVKDMLSLGFSGHCSEISSAGRQEAAGCWAQAWSASTLLELLLLHMP